MDFCRGFLGTTNTFRARIGAVDCEYTSVGEQPNHHESSTDEKQGTTAHTVDEEHAGNGHDNVDDVLNGRRDEEVVSRQTGHFKDILKDC
jgi:hypothetical protein